MAIEWNTIFDTIDLMIARYSPFKRRGTKDPLLDPLPDSCPSCDYSLEGLAAEGECPECGREYTQGTVKRAKLEKERWRRNTAWRVYGGLLLLDAIATFIFFVVRTSGDLTDRIINAVVFALQKVLLLDGLLVMSGLVLIVLLSKRSKPSRGLYIARGAKYGGMMAAIVLVLYTFLPIEILHLPIAAFAWGIGVGGITGWLIHVIQPNA